MGLSRRVFSALAGSSVLGLALGGSMSEVPSEAGAYGPVPTGQPGPPAADGVRHRVAVERDALVVDGRRLVLWSGELHPFRLPSPALWRDVLEKIRAHGCNAVTVPLAWNTHSPAPGRYDFTGVRDLGGFLRTAAEVGLYVVLRPGPRIGAGVDSGGLPGWLTARPGEPEYLRQAGEWLSRVNAVAARHLYTRGTGTVLLYRLDSPHPAEQAALRDRVRADGVDVPVLHEGSAPAWGEVRRPRDVAAARRALLGDVADGVTLHSVNTVFGGSSWGWLAASSAPGTEYDPTAGIDEARRPTERLVPLHQVGHLLRHVPDLARLEPAAEVAAPGLDVRHLADPDTGAEAYVLRNDSAAPVTSRVRMAGTDVKVTVPAGDARLLATGLDLGQGRKLAYATVQPMMTLKVGRVDLAVFTGRPGEMAHVVLDCPQEPWTVRLDEEGAWAYDQGKLHVTVELAAGTLTRVRVRNPDSDRLLLLFFTDDAYSLRLWPRQTPTGSVLVRGPGLLRSADLDGDTVRLTGDTVGECDLEVWAPRGITDVTWNGARVATTASRAGGLVTTARLPGVPDLAPPALGPWRRRAENPESAPGYDDSAWPTAGRVLDAGAHGFHHGDVWYRARLTGAAGLGSVALSYATGAQGLLMAWLDGTPLGTHRVSAEDTSADTPGTWRATARFPTPGNPLLTDEAVLSVLVRRTQQDEDAPRAARGLTSADFTGAAPRARWRLQGAAAADPVRGPLNTGGLHGERSGWHLPDHDDADWEPVDAPRSPGRQGVTWYRTSFRLDVPPEVDASLGLTLEGTDRVQVFLNGWNLGQHTGDTTPAPHTFVLPTGLLHPRATPNTLALAVLSDGEPPTHPLTPHLTLLGSALSGAPGAP
ncbi:beta-galactosidase [Streptomyces sp. NPDC048182]|uniref:glycoside hydrolase family 35 protein n=1 Tax=Streptomyces sp. NPDC048182 TaxID=3365507 RepID=UPI003722AF2E